MAEKRMHKDTGYQDFKDEKPILRPTRESLDECIAMVKNPKRDTYRENGNGCVHPYAFLMQEAVKLAKNEAVYWRRNLLNKKTQNDPTKQLLATDQSGYSE